MEEKLRTNAEVQFCKIAKETSKTVGTNRPLSIAADAKMQKRR